MSLAIPFVAVALFSIAVYYALGFSNAHSLFRIDQCRPANPLGGYLPGRNPSSQLPTSAQDEKSS